MFVLQLSMNKSIPPNLPDNLQPEVKKRRIKVEETQLEQRDRQESTLLKSTIIRQEHKTKRIITLQQTEPKSEPNFNNNIKLTHFKEAVQVLFKPVNMSWQFRKSGLLGLPVLKCHSWRPASHPIGFPNHVKSIGGDGNCFFRCLSFVVTGSEEYHAIIRSSIVSHMLKNPDVMLTGRDTCTYIQDSQMARSGTWASENEIYGASHLLKTDIYVYSQYGRTHKWMNHSGTMLERNFSVEPQSIYLKHTGLTHYEVVLSPEPSAENTDISDTGDPFWKEITFQIKQQKNKDTLQENEPHFSKNIQQQGKVKGNGSRNVLGCEIV